MLAMTAALPREISGVLRAMAVERREVVGACQLSIGTLQGRPLAVARSGVGAEHARGAVDALRDRVPVSGVLSIGFGGALVDGLEAGDLVTSRWIHIDREADEALRADPGWLGRLTAFAEAGGLRVRQGASVTAARMVTDPGQRRRLADRFDADVVDMEGYWLAEACAAHGVPFVSVRAVSDTAEEHHPVLERALDGDHVRVGRAVLGFATRPREMAKLPRLAANAQRAAAALTRFALLASAAAAEEVGA